MKVGKRDKFGRFAPSRKKLAKVVPPKRDAFGRFLGKSPLAGVVDEVVRRERKLVEEGRAQSPVIRRKELPTRKKVSKKRPKLAPKRAVKPVVKRQGKPTAQRPIKKPAKPVAKKPAKPVAKKPAKPVAKKPVKPVAKKPVKPVKAETKKPAKGETKKPAKAGVKKPAKAVAKKPVKAVAKKPAAPKKSVRATPKKPPKKPSKKPPKKRKKPPKLPPLDERSKEAEAEIQTKIVALSEAIGFLEPGLQMGIQTMINIDGTVDGELRIENLPEPWRDEEGFPELIATLSGAFASFRVFERYPSMGGSFWFSVAVRFGPQNDSEIGDLAALYKKYRGLFQIGTYPTRADHLTPLQLCLTDDRMGLRSMVQSLMLKRGLPPTSILIRFIWGPNWHPDVAGKRPGHYKDEKGYVDNKNKQ